MLSDIPPMLLKKSLIIAPFFNYNSSINRPRLVSEVLASYGPVDIVTTNFDHLQKKKKKQVKFEDERAVFYLKTLPYKNNVSVKRFLSHFMFSLRAWFFYL